VDDARRFAPAAARNRQPILDVLTRFVQPGARVLEIASGSGEHAVFLADGLKVASWQPTDPDPASRTSIDAWRTFAHDDRILRALELDVVRDEIWPSADLVLCINMIHIAPWEACVALMRGAARALSRGGLLCLYGPYKREGAHTAPSNAEFDASLRSRNPAWGVRDLEAVLKEAESNHFRTEEIVPMPANNLSVVLRRG
jgi:hypothetical protein